MRRARPLGVFLGAFLALLAGSLRAGTGLTEVPGVEGDNPVTVFYPSQAADAPLKRGPFTLRVAYQGAPAKGNGRLVVLSHGSGGSAWTYADLARALVEAGFVVAVPLHRGDNYGDINTTPKKSCSNWPRCSSSRLNAYEPWLLIRAQS